jgi:hypothetical protein
MLNQMFCVVLSSELDHGMNVEPSFPAQGIQWSKSLKLFSIYE